MANGIGVDKAEVNQEEPGLAEFLETETRRQLTHGESKPKSSLRSTARVVGTNGLFSFSLVYKTDARAQINPALLIATAEAHGCTYVSPDCVQMHWLYFKNVSLEVQDGYVGRVLHEDDAFSLIQFGRAIVVLPNENLELIAPGPDKFTFGETERPW